MLISVDTEELERLSDVFLALGTKSDDSYEKLRKISNEMAYDVDLLSYPQGASATEMVSYAVNSLNQVNGSVQSLKGLLLTLAEFYKDKEKEYSSAISRITAIMDSLNVNVNTAITSPDIAIVEVTDEVDGHSDIQRLVDESAVQMQITNIAAVNKVIEEDYDINDVKTFSETD